MPANRFASTMKKLLVLAACVEVLTGLALLIVPSRVSLLLFGEELNGVATPIAGMTGIALIALGVACWPGPALIGMLTYGALVALYLAYISLAGGWTGLLLWPAVVLHVVLTGLLIWASARNKEANPEAY
jgi:hypothetical protein